MALARVFGCARVVYNDSLRLREECYATGVKISDSEVQRRVITLAKLTPERVWLAEVSSVALVQACDDARRAYRNWFDSLAGVRKGRRVRHPVFRRKRGKQSVRLTRNGFRLRGRRLYVAKVGELRVRWSRPLPSVPSSVTVIREPDGRYYASFVVDRLVTPLPASGHEVGVDVGLDRLAVTSDGEIIANPRLATSVHDAGWAQLLRLIGEKATQYGRTFHQVGRYTPTSQICSACGVKDGPKPLQVRSWQCGMCGAVHDRDVNAARNVLAAGRAERLNACGGTVRPGALLARPGETGTHRGAA
jgi:putative transposase